MRHILSLAFLPVISFALVAQSPGRIQGKITDKAGKPIQNATITLKRVGINWTKEIKTKKDGSYFQGGLEAKEFEITYSAEGYVTSKLISRIPAGDALDKDVTMLTPEEASAENPGAATVSASQTAQKTGVEAFNGALVLYNAQKYSEALPMLESAYTAYRESLEKTTSEAARATIEGNMVIVERVYGLTMYEVGKADEAQKAAIWKKADPILTTVFPKLPETDVPVRLRVSKALLEISQDKKDAAAISQYQAIVDKLEPPNPAVDYNKAVEAFNAGNMSEAKLYLDRTLNKDPKYPRAYYLLGMVEYGNNNLKATKASFLKYLELAPNGDKANDIKAMLDDPSLKHLK